MKLLTALPAILLPFFLLKISLGVISAADSVVFIALSALYAGWFYYEQKKEPEPNAALKNRLVELEEQVKIQKDKVNAITLTAGLKR